MFITFVNSDKNHSTDDITIIVVLSFVITLDES